jgi:outer membrane protein OmpA-like peptidoglycan-associated protein
MALNRFIGICIILCGWVFPAHVLGLDCKQHVQIGIDLHLSKSSSAIADDAELMENIQHHYQEALRLCPDICVRYPAVCNNLGDIYKHQGKTDLAIQCFKKALSYNPDNGDACFELGTLYEQQGLLCSAMDGYLRALTVNPDDKEAEQNIKRLLRTTADKLKWHTFQSAEAGEVIPEKQLHNTLICQDVLKRAAQKFDVPARNILPVAVAMRNIRFESGNAQLTPGSSKQLNEVAGMMSKHPDMKLIIEGHTDDLPVTGPLLISPGVFCADNQCLSEKRAESVRRYLVHNGVPTDRLAVEGYGDARPYDPSDRDKNRRVQFRMK